MKYFFILLFAVNYTITFQYSQSNTNKNLLLNLKINFTVSFFKMLKKQFKTFDISQQSFFFKSKYKFFKREKSIIENDLNNVTIEDKMIPAKKSIELFHYWSKNIFKNNVHEKKANFKIDYIDIIDISNPITFRKIIFFFSQFNDNCNKFKIYLDLIKFLINNPIFNQSNYFGNDNKQNFLNIIDKNKDKDNLLRFNYFELYQDIQMMNEFQQVYREAFRNDTKNYFKNFALLDQNIDYYENYIKLTMEIIKNDCNFKINCFKMKWLHKTYIQEFHDAKKQNIRLSPLSK